MRENKKIRNSSVLSRSKPCSCMSITESKLYLPLPPGPPRMTRPRGAPLTGGRPRKKLPLPRPMFGGLGPSGGQDSGSSCIPSGPAPKEVVGAWLSFGDILKSCSSSVGGPSHFLFSPIGGGGPIAGPNFMSSRDGGLFRFGKGSLLFGPWFRLSGAPWWPGIARPPLGRLQLPRPLESVPCIANDSMCI